MRLSSGTAPENELNWRFNEVRRVRFLIAAGMLPEKELKERSRTVILGERGRGMLPEKLLC